MTIDSCFACGRSQRRVDLDGVGVCVWKMIGVAVPAVFAARVARLPKA
jgi:hypothetical protein